MAEKAETLNFEIQAEEGAVPVVVEAVPEPPQQDAVTEVKRVAAEKYEGAKTWAIESYARAAENAEEAAARVRHNFRVIRDERPLLIVGIVAATAFVVGVVLRVWRSKYDV